MRSRSAANGIEAVSAPQAYLDLSRRWCSNLRIECGQCVMTETDGRSLGGTDCADWGLFQDLSACNELARREGGEVPDSAGSDPSYRQAVRNDLQMGSLAAFLLRVLELNCDRGAAESTASPGTPTGNVNGWIGLRGDTGKPHVPTFHKTPYR